MNITAAASHPITRPGGHDKGGNVLGGIIGGVLGTIADSNDTDDTDTYYGSPDWVNDQVIRGRDRSGFDPTSNGLFAHAPGGVSGNANGVAHTLQLPFSPSEYKGPAVTDMSTWHNDDFGAQWRNQSFGFSLADDSYMLAADPAFVTTSKWNPQDTTLFEMDPVTGSPMGPIGSPEKNGFEMAPFSSVNEVYATLLNGMADPNPITSKAKDNTAGLYLASANFNPAQPPDASTKLTGANAMTSLEKGQSLMYKVPFGQWEKLDSLQDLNMYLYTQEPGQPAAPAA